MEGKGRGRGVERKGGNGKGTHLGLDPVPLLFLRIYVHAAKILSSSPPVYYTIY